MYKNLCGSSTKYELKSKNQNTPKDQTQNYKSGPKKKINEPKLSRKVLHRSVDNLGET